MFKLMLSLVLLLVGISCFAADDSLTREEREILDRGEISQGAYVGGGVVGTILGLGIGHAIQGRYSERGWLFTLAEGVGAGLYIAGETDCIVNAIGDALFGQPHQCSSTMAGVGAGLFIGFKLFETIDLWATPPARNEEYRRVQQKLESHPKPVSFYLAPIPGRNELRGGMVFFF